MLPTGMAAATTATNHDIKTYDMTEGAIDILLLAIEHGAFLAKQGNGRQRAH